MIENNAQKPKLDCNYLRPYLEMLGKFPDELLHAAVALAGSTINEKDCALQALLDGSEIAQFRQTYDRQESFAATHKAIGLS